MKLCKILVMVLVSVLLTACGGHDFEGEYAIKSTSSNQFMNDVADALGVPTIIIGSDYIESDGQRQEFESIFVRESGSQSFLVFESDDGEETFRIIDENTLAQGRGLMGVKLVRLD